MEKITLWGRINNLWTNFSWLYVGFPNLANLSMWYTYIEKLLAIYLKVKFNWVFCHFSGNPEQHHKNKQTHEQHLCDSSLE